MPTITATAEEAVAFLLSQKCGTCLGPSTSDYNWSDFLQRPDGSPSEWLAEDARNCASDREEERPCDLFSAPLPQPHGLPLRAAAIALLPQGRIDYLVCREGARRGWTDDDLARRVLDDAAREWARANAPDRAKE